MVSTKKTSSKSKSLSSSHKKGKLGLPMKKQSPKKLSPMKSTVVTSSRRSNYQHMVTEALTKVKQIICSYFNEINFFSLFSSIHEKVQVVQKFLII